MGHPSSTGGPRVLRFPLYDDTSRTSLTRSVSPRLEAIVNDLLFWSKRVACPGESLTLDPANLACPNWPPTTGIGIRPTPCSVLVGI